MNTEQEVKIDERTVAVVNASSRWALNFVLFALLVDVIYRGAVRNEAAWDLFALVIIGSGISTVHLARQKVLGQVFGWKIAIISIVVAMVVGAVIAAILTITKAI
jgi:hypothetical protein